MRANVIGFMISASVSGGGDCTIYVRIAPGTGINRISGGSGLAGVASGCFIMDGGLAAIGAIRIMDPTGSRSKLFCGSGASIVGCKRNTGCGLASSGGRRVTVTGCSVNGFRVMCTLIRNRSGRFFTVSPGGNVLGPTGCGLTDCINGGNRTRTAIGVSNMGTSFTATPFTRMAVKRGASITRGAIACARPVTAP